MQRREAIAGQLADAIERIGQLYSDLMSNDEVTLLSPFSKPGYGWATIDKHGIDREVSWNLHGQCKQHHLLEPGSVGLGVTGTRSIGVDGAVREQNEAILHRLETVPIAEDLLDEAI